MKGTPRTFYLEEEEYIIARTKAVQYGYASFSSLIRELVQKWIEQETIRTLQDVEREEKQLELQYMAQKLGLEQQKKKLLAKQDKQQKKAKALETKEKIKKMQEDEIRLRQRI